MKYHIYKIVCNDLDVKYTYVGSTKNWINRKRLHKFHSNNEKMAKRKLYKIINENGGWSYWSMILLETILCDSKAEARELEQKYYKELNASLNTIRPLRTSEELKEYSAAYYNDNKITIKENKKQYYLHNKETIKEHQKQYKTANKEKIAAYTSEKILCEVCKCYHRRSDKSQHKKSLKHQKNINKIFTNKVLSI